MWEEAKGFVHPPVSDQRPLSPKFLSELKLKFRRTGASRPKSWAPAPVSRVRVLFPFWGNRSFLPAPLPPCGEKNTAPDPWPPWTLLSCGFLAANPDYSGCLLGMQTLGPLGDLAGPGACMAVMQRKGPSAGGVENTEIRNKWLIGAKTSGWLWSERLRRNSARCF